MVVWVIAFIGLRELSPQLRARRSVEPTAGQGRTKRSTNARCARRWPRSGWC